MYAVGKNQSIFSNAKGLEYSKIKDAIDFIDLSFEEINCNLRDIHFTMHNDSLRLVLGKDDYYISEWATSQLCNFLHIPKSYLDYCSTYNANVLVLDNLNSWCRRTNKEIKLNVYDRSVRGIVSNKYLRISHSDVLNVLESKLGNQFENFKFTDECSSPDYMHIRMIEKEPFYIDKTGSPMFLGYYLQNSEVGRSHLIIDSFIYRQVCSNGLCLASISKSFRKKHYGKHEFNLNTLGGFMFDFNKTLDTGKLANRFQIVENTTLSFELAEKFLDKIHLTNVIKLENESDVNLYTLVNLITHQAKFYPVETRLQLEKQAGDLFDKYSVSI